MVASLIPEHPHHERAVAAINQRLTAGDTMVVVPHTLLETYSTLTRLPLPSRVSPNDALAGIEDTFLVKGLVVALRHDQYVHLLHRPVDEGTLGGQVYDAAILVCARHASVTESLTFNERNFRRVEGDGLIITVP